VLKAFNSYVAGAAEISVRRQQGEGPSPRRRHRSRLRGQSGADRAQVAGSFVYGLSAAFMQECTVKDGRIEQTNFHEYNSMRIAQMPKVETVVLQGGGPVWGGIGEPTICVAAPAVLNAYLRATGKRIRSVPLKNHGIRWCEVQGA
jgi:isoquinoline 1-oxidoreductase beta subunit